uniref:Uncharacterized protein n=1 Tax=Arundo donax TaxID=35708 RepID=A0A0A9BXX1_ARUDO
MKPGESACSMLHFHYDLHVQYFPLIKLLLHLCMPDVEN